MGIWNTVKNVGSLGLAPLTGGLSLLGTSEDFRSGLPIIGPLTGAKSDEQKALEATQQRLAAEQKQRMEQQRQVGMQNMANRLMAFAPLNNHVIASGGQGYSPQQMQQFAADPSGGAKADPAVQQWMSFPNEIRDQIRNAAMKPGGIRSNPIVGGPNMPIPNYTPEQVAQLDQQALAFSKQQGDEQRRQAMVGAAFQGAPSGPAPIQMSAPAQARRF